MGRVDHGREGRSRFRRRRAPPELGAVPRDDWCDSRAGALLRWMPRGNGVPQTTGTSHRRRKRDRPSLPLATLWWVLGIGEERERMAKANGYRVYWRAAIRGFSKGVGRCRFRGLDETSRRRGIRIRDLGPPQPISSRTCCKRWICGNGCSRCRLRCESGLGSAAKAFWCQWRAASSTVRTDWCGSICIRAAWGGTEE